MVSFTSLIIRSALSTSVFAASAASLTSCWRDTLCTGPSAAAFPGSWDKYNYSPVNRTVSPVTILKLDGTFISNFPGTAVLKGDGSELLFDFGKEVGGIVTVSYSANGTGSLGLTFTEARNWTGQNSDHSRGSFVAEPALLADITTTAQSSYTIPDSKLRGGFRYLTLFSKTSTDVTIDILAITVEITFQPAWSNLRAYKGYFSCSDDLLNKIWYSGAYTLQTNAIPPNTGRQFPISGEPGWMNNENLNAGSNAPTIYVDGSKRDRTVWPGDLGIAVTSLLVSTGDWDGIRNTLDVLYNVQASSGELPFAGPAINLYGSDTYHLATLLGTYDYFLWTNDKPWFSRIYPKFKNAIDYIIKRIDSTGLLYVDDAHKLDWGRSEHTGRNSEANMLMYETLVRASKLAKWTGDASSSSSWSTLAVTLKKALNSMSWDDAAGAFKDTDTDGPIHPQDANSMALAFEVADPSRMQKISSSLTKNWNAIGAVSPELPNNIVGFVESFEIKGHLMARQATRALDLIRRSWGWYLNNPYGTASTCIEGYLADGSFGYRSDRGYNNDPSYTSHAHGWSTGPTDALTTYIAGLRLTSPSGTTWQLSPQFGDLTHAEAGFTTPLGKFTASWTLTPTGYTVSWGAPKGTVGTIILPGREDQPIVTMDGRQRALTEQGISWNQTTMLITFETQSIGANHTAKVTY